MGWGDDTRMVIVYRWSKAEEGRRWKEEAEGEDGANRTNLEQCIYKYYINMNVLDNNG